jgi:manganese-transporting P-type ATPase
VFVVNLKGRPFMGGLTENRPLLYSLAATFALVFMSARYAICSTLLNITIAYCCKRM